MGGVDVEGAEGKKGYPHREKRERGWQGEGHRKT